MVFVINPTKYVYDSLLYCLHVYTTYIRTDKLVCYYIILHAVITVLTFYVYNVKRNVLHVNL
jgi:hypothetical protein